MINVMTLKFISYFWEVTYTVVPLMECTFKKELRVNKHKNNNLSTTISLLNIVFKTLFPRHFSAWLLFVSEAKEIDAILATPINVRLSSDEATPCISGAEFMSSGYLVICDRNNMKVKVLDNSFVVTGSATLPSEPIDVSEIDSNRAVVTLPELKQCMVIEILPTSLGVSPYNLCEKELWGIHMLGAEIYAVYENELKTRGIMVLDFQKRKVKAVF